MDISVYFYRVATNPDSTLPFEDTIDQIEALNIGQRNRVVQRTDVRLETATRVGRGRILAFDLTRLRYDHGPGRADRNGPMRGFNLAVTEGFGEETAFLYDPGTRVLVAQYNHFGVRIGVAEGYFNSFVPQFQQGTVGAYELLPILDLAAERRFQRFDSIRKVSFKIAASRAQIDDRHRGASVQDALEINEMFRGDKVAVEITCDAQNRRGLARNAVEQLFGALRRIGDEVVDLSVKGKSGEAEAEEIDLFAHRLKAEIQGVRERPRDRRVPFDDRVDALQRAHRGIHDQLQRRFGG